MLNKYAGQSLPKEKALEHLLLPLAPLKVDIESLKSENDILTELLS